MVQRDTFLNIDYRRFSLMLGKIEGRRRRGQQRMRCLDGIIYSMDMNLSKQLEIVKYREAWPATVHGVAKSMGCKWLSDWTITIRDLLYNWKEVYTFFSKFVFMLFARLKFICDSKRKGYARREVFSKVRICLMLISILSENHACSLIEELLWVE